MNVERRHALRKVPDEAAFIQLERENGGAVLNISEGGLAFQANAPVQQNGPMHFCLWLDVGNHVEAVGEVAWLNENKKVGGLRFLELDQRASEQIHTWMNLSAKGETPAGTPAPPATPASMPARVRPMPVEPVEEEEPRAQAPAGAPTGLAAEMRGPTLVRTSETQDEVRSSFQAPAAKPKLVVAAANSSEALRAEGQDAERRAEARTAYQARAGGSTLRVSRMYSPAWLNLGEQENLTTDAEKETSFGQAGPEAAASAEVSNTRELVPLERHRVALRRQVIKGFILGVLASAVVAVPAFEIFKGGPRPETPQKTAVEKAGPERQAAPTAQPERAPAAAAKTPDLSASGTGKEKGQQGSSYKPDNPALSGEAHSGARVPGSAAASRSPFAPAAARTSTSSGANSAYKRASPEELWAAVQAGNTKAAVVLADRYLTGDGVVKNCDQARVLLLVASQKGSNEARKKLADLNHVACP